MTNDKFTIPMYITPHDIESRSKYTAECESMINGRLDRFVFDFDTDNVLKSVNMFMVDGCGNPYDRKMYFRDDKIGNEYAFTVISDLIYNVENTFSTIEYVVIMIDSVFNIEYFHNLDWLVTINDDGDIVYVQDLEFSKKHAFFMLDNASKLRVLNQMDKDTLKKLRIEIIKRKSNVG